MQKLYPTPVVYPEIKLWDQRVPDEQRLQIVNEQDFPKYDIMRGLGLNNRLLDSFGITNVEEIRERQALIKFFVENPEAISFIKGAAVNQGVELPMNESDFLRYFRPDSQHNPYWKLVHRFLEILDRAPELPSRLHALYSALSETLPVEGDELDMADFITDRLTNMAVFEGHIEYSLTTTFDHLTHATRKGQPTEGRQVYRASYLLPLEDKSEVHGHSLYSFDQETFVPEDYPDWTDKKWHLGRLLGFGWLTRKMYDASNRAMRDSAYQAMVFDEISESLEEDLREGVLAELQKLPLTKDFDGGTVKVYFTYDHEGLQILIYGLEPKIEDWLVPHSYARYQQFAGYTTRQMQRVMVSMKEFENEAERCWINLKTAEALRKVSRRYPEFLSRKRKIKSARTDHEHRWFALRNLYGDVLVSSVVAAVRKHRDYFCEQLNTLNDIASIAESMLRVSTQTKMPLCFPQIVSDESHVVQFDEMLPGLLLHKLPKDEHPVPISGLEPINGRIIGLTGAHGGGKTVASLTVAELIWLAQSGLPVLGRGVRLNVKDVLGLVFIERGEGSTIQLYLEKVHALLKAIKDIDGHRVVIILDELGSATQEADGLKMGRGLLSTFANAGVSVIYSTQIMDLAHYSEDALGAICYQFTRSHQMNPGINDGGLGELLTDMGITEMLIA